jgi:hypothetical protein
MKWAELTHNGEIGPEFPAALARRGQHRTLANLDVSYAIGAERRTRLLSVI